MINILTRMQGDHLPQSAGAVGQIFLGRGTRPPPLPPVARGALPITRYSIVLSLFTRCLCASVSAPDFATGGVTGGRLSGSTGATGFNHVGLAVRAARPPLCSPSLDPRGIFASSNSSLDIALALVSPANRYRIVAGPLRFKCLIGLAVPRAPSTGKVQREWQRHHPRWHTRYLRSARSNRVQCSPSARRPPSAPVP